MKPTGPGDLLPTFGILFVLTYGVLRLRYDTIPPVQYAVAIPIAVLGIIELIISARVRAVVRHDPEAKPMTAISIARLVALGRASSLVAAGVLGAAAALLVRVVPQAGSVHAAASDLRVSIVVLAGSGLLLAAGLVLERAGIDPGQGAARGHSDSRAA